jgi:hypothetical protein
VYSLESTVADTCADDSSAHFGGHSGIVSFTMNDSRNGLDGYFLLRVKSRAFRSTLAGHSCSMSNETCFKTSIVNMLQARLLTELAGWWLSGPSK